MVHHDPLTVVVCPCRPLSARVGRCLPVSVSCMDCWCRWIIDTPQGKTTLRASFDVPASVSALLTAAVLQQADSPKSAIFNTGSSSPRADSASSKFEGDRSLQHAMERSDKALLCGCNMVCRASHIHTAKSSVALENLSLGPVNCLQAHCSRLMLECAAAFHMSVGKASVHDHEQVNTHNNTFLLA